MKDSKKPSPASFSKPNLAQFQFVPSSGSSVRGQTRRDPPGCNVTPSGTIEFNMAGTDIVVDIAIDQELDPESFAAHLGGNPETKQVAMVLVPSSTPDAKSIRRYEGSPNFTTYLQDVFTKHPTLRPKSAGWCSISREPDGDGGEYVLIHLNVALERRTTGRRKGKSTPASDVAAAQLLPEE